MKDKKMLGAFIRELRKDAGLSQTDLGNLVGVSCKAVSKWETEEANPDIGVLPGLAQVLGVTTDELLTGERRKSSSYGVYEYGDSGAETDKRRNSYYRGGADKYGNMGAEGDCDSATGEYGDSGAETDKRRNAYYRGGADESPSYDRGHTNRREADNGGYAKEEIPSDDCGFECRENRCGILEEIFGAGERASRFERVGRREFVSKRRTSKGVPYVHVNFSNAASDARGVIAVGFRAKGAVAIGLVARGVVSLGLLSVGCISFGILSVGLLLAFGTFAFGAGLSAGSVAAGFVAFGAIAIGYYAFGAVAVGCYAFTGKTGFALGAHNFILNGVGSRIIPFMQQSVFLK
ncbi:MAG: helix-turn-helix domain-containing protein [Clostridiales bacterium]|jgi:transcriptional regulator with XRE-family HTH domain|nr:helix-turn-helix domain-containing protein [Clostridiales bacterium]